MEYKSEISLVVKVLQSDIFTGMGEIGQDGRATGCEISAICLGADEAGKIFNVNIRTDTSTYEEAELIAGKLACGTIQYIKGIFFLDSNEIHDIITVFHPTCEILSGKEAEFYEKLFNQCKRGHA